MKLKNSFQRTALHIAVLDKKFEIIKLLLNNKKIDIDAKDEINTKKFMRFEIFIYGSLYFFGESHQI